MGSEYGFIRSSRKRTVTSGIHPFDRDIFKDKE
jgi:hypothetical protein